MMWCLSPHGKIFLKRTKKVFKKHTKLLEHKAKVIGQGHYPFYWGTKEEKQRDMGISLQAGTEKGI